MKSITLVVQNLLKPYIDNHRHTAEANLAPVELDATSASASYAVGDKLVLNDVLYDVTAAITAGDALVDSGAGANIAVSDDITTQIKNHTVTTDATPTKNSTNAVQSGGVYSADVAMGGNLATVENESTVSQNYAIGAFFVRNNVRYKALAAITSGTSWSSLVLNTDYEVAPTLSAENQTLTNEIGTLANLPTTDKSSLVGAITEVNTSVSGKASAQSVTDLSTAVNNKHKVTSFQVSTSGWTADTTSQSGVTLQKKSISLSHAYVDCPSVDIGAASGSVLPTTAQQTAYDLLQYVTLDGTTLYLYASDVPTDAFYINVEGVD